MGSSGSGDSIRGMILAAGLGTRLRPLTFGIAKPAVPFLNRPLIHYSLELFESLPVQEIVVNLHHCPDSVRSAVSAYRRRSPEGERPKIRFSFEPQILGTAGGIGNVRDRLTGGDIVVSNGKVYFEEDLREALAFHRRRKAMVTMILLPCTGSEPFNPVVMGNGNRIQQFVLKSELETFENAYIFTGIQILRDKVLDYIPEGPSDTVRDVYPRLIQEGYPILGFVSNSYWAENSWPSRYLEQSLQVLTRKGLKSCLEGEVEIPGRGVVAGPGVEVAKGCHLEDVILWKGSRVGPGSSLRSVILTAGTALPEGTCLRNAIATPFFDGIPQEMLDRAKPRQGFLEWDLTQGERR